MCEDTSSLITAFGFTIATVLVVRESENHQPHGQTTTATVTNHRFLVWIDLIVFVCLESLGVAWTLGLA